jgi:type I restriction enzyme R subunit
LIDESGSPLKDHHARSADGCRKPPAPKDV